MFKSQSSDGIALNASEYDSGPNVICLAASFLCIFQR